MELNDLQSENQTQLWINPVYEDKQLVPGLVKFKPGRRADEFNLYQNGDLIKVVPNSPHKHKGLAFSLVRGTAQLAHIVQTTDTGTVLLRIHFFNGPVVEMGDVSVGLEPQMIKKARIEGFNEKTLTEQCVIGSDEDPDEQYFLMLVGPAVAEGSETKPEVPDSFAVLGQDVKIPVKNQKHANGDDIFVASRLITKGFQRKDGGLRLAKGRLTFTADTERCIAKALATGSVARLVEDKGSYLKQWDDYGKIEGEILLKRVKAVGKLVYSNVEQTAAGVRFYFDEPLPEALEPGDSLEITKELPSYITDPNVDWSTFSEQLLADTSSKETPNMVETIVSLAQKSLVLDLRMPPEKGHFLLLSINGDKTQIERRTKARELIVNERSAIPWLGLVIKENGEVPRVGTTDKIRPLTAFVSDKIFAHPPNLSQVKAIDKALNTPDICLIQGPPGTGKTTVIAAILERLNELQDKSESIRGQVLVTGFQHDAVENIVSRLSVNALPSVKFGRRSGKTDSVVEQKLLKWCQRVAQNVRKQNPQIQHTEQQQKLAVLFAAYAKSPSMNNVRSLLSLVCALPRATLPATVFEQAAIMLEGLESDTGTATPEQLKTLKLIRALRISTVAFEDDGPQRAADVLNAFENQLSRGQKELLRQAVIHQTGQSLAFIQEFKALKIQLLQNYHPKPAFRIEKTRDDILKLISVVSRQLQEHQDWGDQKEQVLAEFLHELEDNPDGAKKSIEDYNFVYAATTGQSVGNAIRKAKTIADDEFIKYDTIIVDEAARVSPRDLLIPMVQASKRIILVGDHRQLPHLIDKQITQTMEAGQIDEGLEVDCEFVKLSMFEYLFERLKNLEKTDRICRTVTLDAQYRTHPLLGQFVSDNFYKANNEQFDSPLKAQLFNHDLPGAEQKAALWFDVPNARRPEVKNKTTKSRYREAEAQAIAKQLSEWMTSDAGQTLSFGVISFYKAQVNAVFEALLPYGITHKDEHGSWQIEKQYQYLTIEKDGKKYVEERFRIGTVDSFQGMEFDVVFLSIVRTQNWQRQNKCIAKQSDPQIKARMVYGHLMSENRLCVSMSRQKKLLAVVGDSQMVQNELGKDHVPALAAYYGLCQQEGLLL